MSNDVSQGVPKVKDIHDMNSSRIYLTYRLEGRG